MSHPLFLQIVNEVEQYDPYFIQRIDAVGVLGLSSLQKITVAYRILAYGTSIDSVDEYIRIGESTAIECNTPNYTMTVLYHVYNKSKCIFFRNKNMRKKIKRETRNLYRIKQG